MRGWGRRAPHGGARCWFWACAPPWPGPLRQSPNALLLVSVLAGAELATVERILINCGDDAEMCWEEDGLCSLLTARGFAMPMEPTRDEQEFQ